MASGPPHSPSLIPSLSGAKASKASTPKRVQDLLGAATFNKRLAWYEVLIRAAESSVPRLTIPETFVTLGEGQGVFLYSDSEGVIRVKTGER